MRVLDFSEFQYVGGGNPPCGMDTECIDEWMKS